MLIRISHHALMSKVGAVTACVESTGVGRSRLIYQEIVYLRNEETACEQPLEEMAPRLIAYTGDWRFQ